MIIMRGVNRVSDPVEEAMLATDCAAGISSSNFTRKAEGRNGPCSRRLA